GINAPVSRWCRPAKWKSLSLAALESREPASHRNIAFRQGGAYAERRDLAPPRSKSVASNNRYPIVGIGASAGGLEALEGLLRPLPTDTGMSFAIVTHLARGHVSSLVEILSRYTRMPVTTAADGAVLERNHVYVCPPDHIMTMVDGRLGLQLRADE